MLPRPSVAYRIKVRPLFFVEPAELEILKYASLLHDIGKIGIPDAILLKPGRLTPYEYQIMKMHPVFSYEIVSKVDRFRELAVHIRHHHERCDGSGYPEGLKCKEIPVLARITAVADVVEAMLTERPYKGKHTPEEVFSYLKEESGTLFDEDVVNAALTVRETLMNIVKSRG